MTRKRPLYAFVAGGMAVALLAPFAVALHYREPQGIAFAVASALVLLLTRLLLPYRQDVASSSGAYRAVAVSWLLAVGLASLPFALTGATVSPVDAVFEAASGLTTTGSTVLDGLETLPRSVLFWRAFLQWLGGMGLITLSAALLPRWLPLGATMLQAEAPGPPGGLLRPGSAATAALLWTFYVSFTLLEVVILYLAGLSWFDAVVHSFATLSTGGFSNHTTSAAAFASPAVRGVLLLFMFLAGLNFARYADLLFRPQPWAERIRHLFRDGETRLYIGILVFSSGLVGWILIDSGADPAAALGEAAFQVVSLATTTGLTTTDYDTWPVEAQITLLLLMLVGGSSGSTAGGFKLIRVLLLAAAVRREFLRIRSPRRVTVLHLGGRVVSSQVIRHTLLFALLYSTSLIAGTFVLTWLELPPTTALGAAATALANVGPGFESLGPAATYAELRPVTKLTLVFLMLLGRLELFTLFTLLAHVPRQGVKHSRGEE